MKLDWIQWYYLVWTFIGMGAKCVLHGKDIKQDCRFLPLAIIIGMPVMGRMMAWW